MRLRLLGLIWITFAALMSGPAFAFPDRPVRVIVPFPAGGGTDALSRILAEALSQRLGQKFVVENISGAGGNVGAARVTQADPDGHTLLIGSMGVLSVNPLIYKNVGTTHVDKLTAISLVFETGHLIVANPSVKATNLADLAQVAKDRKGALNYASGGIGTSTHLYAELFSLLTGAPMTHVPYRGNGPALQDVVAGHAQVMFDQIGNSSEQVRAGTVRGLAVTTSQRLPILPDVPTTAELGMPELSGTSWTILMAPRGIPAAIVEKLNAAVASAVADQVVREKMEAIGASARASSASDAQRLITTELERWQPVVAATGLSAN